MMKTITIAIVEDIPVLREGFRRIFTDGGFQVLLAATDKAALLPLLEQQDMVPAICVVSVELLRSDNELRKLLCERSPHLAQIKVLGYSKYEDPAGELMAEELNIDGFIDGTIKLKALVQLIAELVREPARHVKINKIQTDNNMIIV